MATLSLHQVTKQFRGRAAVCGVDLDIASGEFFAVLGPSGCGKTTLLRLIAGYERADSGSIVLGGRDITHCHPRDREMGMVFQNYALFPQMTVFENVAFGLESRHMGDREVRDRVNGALDAVHMTQKATEPVTTLSGGEQQRVAVARALVLRPQVLLFDEPLSNLDAALRTSTREEIKTLQRESGVTTVYVTHDQGEGMTLADRIAVMRDGVVRQVGTPRELYEAPEDPFVAGFLGGANLLEGLLSAEGIFQQGAFRIVLPPSHYRPPGRATLALKPEGILLAGEGIPGSVPARVDAVEYMGWMTTLRVASQGVSLRVMVPWLSGAVSLRRGMTIWFTIDWEKAFVFPGGE